MSDKGSCTHLRHFRAGIKQHLQQKEKENNERRRKRTRDAEPGAEEKAPAAEEKAPAAEEETPAKEEKGAPEKLNGNDNDAATPSRQPLAVKTGETPAATHTNSAINVVLTPTSASVAAAVPSFVPQLISAVGQYRAELGLTQSTCGPASTGEQVSNDTSRLCACISCGAVILQSDCRAHWAEGRCPAASEGTPMAANLEAGIGTNPGHHPLFLSLPECNWYCAACNDYVYDAAFDRQVLADTLHRLPNAAAALAKKVGASGHSNATGSAVQAPPNKRAKVGGPDGAAIEAKAVGLITLSDKGERVQRIESKKKEGKKSAIFPLGLRGIVNLGNTCYMSCVMQSLIANNIVRHLFLSEYHVPETCKRAAEGLPCIACELHAAFVAAYGGIKEPYVPTAMLTTWWRHQELMMGGGGKGGGLVGREVNRQQDAHEFFVVALDAMREQVTVNLRGLSGGGGRTKSKPAAATAAGGSTGKKDASASENLAYPLNDIFQGCARSDVTCCKCGFTSTTFDKFTALSLDVRKQFCMVAPSYAADTMEHSRPLDDSGTAARAEAAPVLFDDGPDLLQIGEGGAPTSPAVASGLVGAQARSVATFSNDATSQLETRSASVLSALQQYTAPEKLGCSGGGEGFVCPKCKSEQEAVKQMSISHLPAVLCLHLKRFEHDTRNRGGASRKIDSHVRFSMKLDMSAFSTSAILQNRYGHRLRLPPVKKLSRPTYTLSSCIVHSGNFEGGHYITYAKHEKNWYRCDDACVSSVQLSEVKKAQAYLLFYVMDGH